ncbi:MAG: hypothetical protein ACKOFM_07360, partial [Actinomycetota bacterium]
RQNGTAYALGLFFNNFLVGEVNINNVVRGAMQMGTIVTVGAVEVGQRVFNPDALHALRLGRDAVEDVFRTLATESLADRVHNPGLPRDRADLIVGGCCVLVALLRRLQISEIVVSQHNLLDGLISEMRKKFS